MVHLSRSQYGGLALGAGALGRAVWAERSLTATGGVAGGPALRSSWQARAARVLDPALGSRGARYQMGFPGRPRCGRQAVLNCLAGGECATLARVGCANSVRPRKSDESVRWTSQWGAGRSSNRRVQLPSHQSPSGWLLAGGAGPPRATTSSDHVHRRWLSLRRQSASQAGHLSVALRADRRPLAPGRADAAGEAPVRPGNGFVGPPARATRSPPRRAADATKTPRVP
jgi:hypothetical protein